MGNAKNNLVLLIGSMLPIRHGNLYQPIFLVQCHCKTVVFRLNSVVPLLNLGSRTEPKSVPRNH